MNDLFLESARRRTPIHQDVVPYSDDVGNLDALQLVKENTARSFYRALNNAHQGTEDEVKLDRLTPFFQGVQDRLSPLALSTLAGSYNPDLLGAISNSRKGKLKAHFLQHGLILEEGGLNLTPTYFQTHIEPEWFRTGINGNDIQQIDALIAKTCLLFPRWVHMYHASRRFRGKAQSVA